mgnify:CR=1 FL=1
MSGLAIHGLSAGYGDIAVLHDVSFDVRIPGITAVIGSNGAGKTTLLRALSGLLKPTSGSIRLNDVDLSGRAPDGFVAARVAHVPEGRRLFAGMSVEDNLLMGAFTRKASKAEIAADLDAIYTLFPKLKERRRQDAVSMSGGEQQMCAIGRGVMAKPSVMLIDELSLGLAPVVVDDLIAALRTLAADGLGLLVVEQDIAVAFDLADHVVIMDRGHVAKSGPSDQLMADPAIQAAYLGEM